MDDKKARLLAAIELDQKEMKEISELEDLARVKTKELEELNKKIREIRQGGLGYRSSHFDKAIYGLFEELSGRGKESDLVSMFTKRGLI